MDTSKGIPKWQVVAASVCGTSHIRKLQLCQDAYHCKVLPNSTLLAVVADGAGSAKLGQMGAIVAVETAIKYISAQDVIEEILGDDTAVKSFFIDTIIATKQTMEKEAVACSSQSQDLATTLIIVLATPNIVAVAQIGDGMVVVKNLHAR